MISAFGVEHGLVSKADQRSVPDWASGAIPASTARAYSHAEKKKASAASRNFVYSSAGTAAGTLAGASLVGLAFKKAKPLKYMPKTFYRSTKNVKLPFSKPTTIGSGEKQRWLGMTVAAPAGALGGGIAGAAHLKHMRKDPKYAFKEDEQ
jgi:hypothetical protein